MLMITPRLSPLFDLLEPMVLGSCIFMAFVSARTARNIPRTFTSRNLLNSEIELSPISAALFTPICARGPIHLSFKHARQRAKENDVAYSGTIDSVINSFKLRKHALDHFLHALFVCNVDLNYQETIILVCCERLARQSSLFRSMPVQVGENNTSSSFDRISMSARLSNPATWETVRESGHFRAFVNSPAPVTRAIPVISMTESRIYVLVWTRFSEKAFCKSLKLLRGIKAPKKTNNEMGSLKVMGSYYDQFSSERSRIDLPAEYIITRGWPALQQRDVRTARTRGWYIRGWGKSSIFPDAGQAVRHQLTLMNIEWALEMQLYPMKWV